MTRLTRAMLYGTVATMALSGFAATALAADFPAVAKPVADAFSGVTFYGTLDVNGYCQDHGTQAPGNGIPSYFIFASPYAANQFCGIGANAMSVSNLGVAIEKPIGYGFTAIGRAETFFNPLTGELLSAVGSVARNNSMLLGNNTAYGDGNSAGQFLNGDVYAGLSSPIFGTVTVGRLKSLEFDALLQYDPFAQSLAFSMVGYYGAFAGMGVTENRRLDNAIKWVYDNAWFHAAALASTGCNDCAQQGAYSFDVGLHNIFGTTGPGSGFSIDGTYGAEKGTVNAFGTFTVSGTNTVPAQALAGVGLEHQIFARISDNEAWTVQAKYTWNLGGGGGQDPGMYTKGPASAPPPTSTFTIYGGWEHVELRDPSNPIVNGTSGLGGFIIGFADNFRYLTPEKIDQYWVGAKYAVNQWTFTGAYYYQQRNDWVAGNVEGGANLGFGQVQPSTGNVICNPVFSTTLKQGTTIQANPGTNCGGNFQSAAFAINYAFNKYVDVYTGVNYNVITGGYGGGQQVLNQTTGITGLRLKF